MRILTRSFPNPQEVNIYLHLCYIVLLSYDVPLDTFLVARLLCGIAVPKYETPGERLILKVVLPGRCIELAEM